MIKFVSVMILTKNPGPEIFDALDMIYMQKVNFGYEVVVVDSGSSGEFLQKIVRYPVRLYSVNPESFNFGLTRDYGFSLCIGDAIVTISQDVVPMSELWLEKMISPLEIDDLIVAVQGRETHPHGKSVFYWEKIGLFYFTSEVDSWVAKYEDGLSFVNCAIRKKFWEKNKIGYALFSEDKVFQRLIYLSSGSIFWHAEPTCFHGHQYNFLQLFVRLRGEGVGWRCVGIKYPIQSVIKDILANKWMLRKIIGKKIKQGDVSFAELLFPLLRPLLIFYGVNFYKVRF